MSRWECGLPLLIHSVQFIPFKRDWNDPIWGVRVIFVSPNRANWLGLPVYVSRYTYDDIESGRSARAGRAD